MPIETSVDHAALLDSALRHVESGEYGTALEELRAVCLARTVPAGLRDRARVAGMQVAARMYDLATMVSFRDAGPANSSEHESALSLLSLVADSMDGSPVAARALLDEVNSRLDGPLPVEEVRFVAESLALAIARSGLGTEFFDVLLRASGMANDAGAPGLVCSLLTAEAAYRSRSNLVAAQFAARRAVDLATADGDLRNLPFALAQLTTAEASLGEAVYEESARQLAAFGVPPAVLVADFAHAMFALTVGDDDTALDVFASLHERHRDDITAPVSWHADLVDLMVGRGDLVGAMSVADSLGRLVEQCSIPWLDAALHRARGATSTDRGVAVGCFDAAVDRYERHGYSIAAARACHSRARWMQRHGETAMSVLADTRMRFDAAGMSRWSDLCR